MIKIVLFVLILSFMSGCHYEIPGMRPAQQPPILLPPAVPEPAVTKIEPFVLTGWKQTRSSEFQVTPFGLAAKLVGRELFITVLTDWMDFIIDNRSFEENYQDSKYVLADDPGTRGNQFWKVNIDSGQNELIARSTWEAAGDRVEFTLGPSEVRPPRLSWTNDVFGHQTSLEKIKPIRFITSQGTIQISSRIKASFFANMFVPSDVYAFVGTLHTPYSRSENLCIEFQTFQSNLWHPLGLVQLAGSNGLVEVDSDWGGPIGFVAKGSRFAYLYQDKLWLVPVPENPFFVPKPARTSLPVTPVIDSQLVRPGHP